MDKKTTILYWIMGMIPFALLLFISSVQNIFQRFSDAAFSLASTGVIAGLFVASLNAVIIFLFRIKFPRLEKIGLILILAIAVFFGFMMVIGGNQKPYAAIDYLTVLVTLLHGVALFLAFDKFYEKPIFPFITLIIFGGLVVLEIPFLLLGILHYFFAGWFPFILCVGTLIALIVTKLKAFFKKIAPEQQPKPKKPYRSPHLEDPNGDLSSKAREVADQARCNFGYGLSDIYPEGVDYYVSMGTIYLTFKYKAKRNGYNYCSSDADVQRAAESAASSAARSVGCTAPIEVSINCLEVFTNI